MALDVSAVRADFACLSKKINGLNPVYMDNACMTLKPSCVVESMKDFYENHPGCHNRSQHSFGTRTTEKFKAARNTVKSHISAARAEEIVFTRNATEAINMVACCLRLKRGDVVITSDFEHNSNLLPWQFLAQKKGIIHKTFPIAPDASSVDLIAFEAILKESPVKLVSTFHTSHVTGISLPVADLARLAQSHGALFLLDAAQALAHHKLDVHALDVDLMAFSFHKAFGPTGVGALYGKMEILRQFDSFLVGGETVLDVDYDTCVLADVPERFEAGLQNYAGIIGSAKALEYLDGLGFESIRRHIAELNGLLTEGVTGCARIRLIGPSNAALRGSIFNFIIEGMKSEEVSVLLDRSHRIMTRSGVHCCHAWYKKHGLQPSVRVSFSVYNTIEEVDTLVKDLRDLTRYF